MAVSPNTEAQVIFEDARRMYDEAVARLESGDLRDAAEKAWCATKRATDALVLARTGEAPGPTGRTSDALDGLRHGDASFETLVGRYYSRVGQLHGRCFYEGVCNPETERRIHETIDYIRDAEDLAGGSA